MKVWGGILVAILIGASTLLLAQEQKPNVTVPKYDPATETNFKGTVDEVRDRECPVSNGMTSTGPSRAKSMRRTAWRSASGCWT